MPLCSQHAAIAADGIVLPPARPSRTVLRGRSQSTTVNDYLLDKLTISGFFSPTFACGSSTNLGLFLAEGPRK